MRTLAVVLGVAILAVGAVRAGSVEVDFNPKAEFEKYKTWAWEPGNDQPRKGVLADATMRKRVETFLAGCLEEVGLRPADPNSKPDVLVRYQGDVGTGKTVNSNRVYLYEGTAPAYSTEQFDEQIATIIVDLIDTSTSTLAWRLYLNQKFGGPNDSADKLQRALEKGFAKYPPSASARAKKARALEKESRAR